jgi:uncharacterized protein YbjQ (UPF0145 family)
MSADQNPSLNEERCAGASKGLYPVISTQPTMSGEAGEAVGIVIAEVVSLENEEGDLFAGLGAFIRAELPQDRAVTQMTLEKLLRELSLKGRKLRADAILSTTITLLRGTNTAGHRLLKMTATGTAVVLPNKQK